MHATDVTNASRTMLWNLKTRDWDAWLLRLFGVPRAMLPEVRDSRGDFGQCDPMLLGAPIPILGVAGDQQAASFGQACFAPGDVKSTYGTGCFALVNTGKAVPHSKNRLLATALLAQKQYAIEGSIFIAGAVVQWLRDELGRGGVRTGKRGACQTRQSRRRTLFRTRLHRLGRALLGSRCAGRDPWTDP